MRTHRVLITCTLLLGACAMDTAPADDGAAPENTQVSSRRVHGTVDRSAAALHGRGTLAAATTAEVITYDEEGTRRVHGAAQVSADGTFAMDASGMTRTFVVEVSDEAGVVIGAVVTTTAAEADDEATTDAGVVTTETTAEAAVWTSVVVSHGWDATTSREVLARVDARLAASIDAWLDAHDDEDALIEVVGDAMVSAQVAREDALDDMNTTWDASLAAVVRAAVASSDSAASFAAGVDGALASEGVAAEDRLAVTARAEATFRAVVQAGLASQDDTATDDSLSMLLAGSAGLEAWLYGEAWDDLDEEADSALLASVAADLRVLASACAPDGDEASSDGCFVLGAGGLVDSALAVELGLDGESLLGDDGLSLDLGALLGLSGSTDAEEEVETFDETMIALRAEVHAQVATAAEASESDAVVSGVAEAYVDLTAQLSDMVEDDQATSAVRAALLLSAGGFVATE